MSLSLSLGVGPGPPGPGRAAGVQPSDSPSRMANALPVPPDSELESDSQAERIAYSRQWPGKRYCRPALTRTRNRGLGRHKRGSQIRVKWMLRVETLLAP